MQVTYSRPTAFFLSKNDKAGHVQRYSVTKAEEEQCSQEAVARGVRQASNRESRRYDRSILAQLPSLQEAFAALNEYHVSNEEVVTYAWAVVKRPLAHYPRTDNSKIGAGPYCRTR